MNTIKSYYYYNDNIKLKFNLELNVDFYARIFKEENDLYIESIDEYFNINSENCINCFGCVYCYDCENCKECSNCENCKDCRNCRSCKNLKNSSDCLLCFN